MKKLYGTLFLSCIISFVLAQGPLLQPSIGISSAPSASDSICPIPVYTGDYDTTGYMQGDTIPDFTLYKLNGDSVNMLAELQAGLPVLLVSGSYTCPVFRNQVADLNSMYTMYNGQLKIFVVYAVEAHPVVDPSPYSGNVWVTSQNQADGVLFRQPATYGERMDMVDSLLANINVLPPVLIDGPCNNWWNNFGPAPNNAYLINANGVVVRKHAWFHRLPDNMYCAVDSLLGTVSGNCNSISYNGNFSFSLVADSIVNGEPGDPLTVYADLVNNSATNMVTVEIQRIQSNLPSAWQSALCHNICLAPTVDSTTVTIAPLATQSFAFHFYTDPSAPGNGDVLVGFRNMNDPLNRYKQRFYGTTSWNTGIAEGNATLFQLYPNPSAGMIYLKLETPLEAAVEVRDISGRLVKEYSERKWSSGDIVIPGDLKPGLYIVSLISGEVVYRTKVIVNGL
jgi:hypothetical protein